MAKNSAFTLSNSFLVLSLLLILLCILSSEVKPAQSQTNTAGSDYKLYQDSNYGFSIEYPSDWTYSKQTPTGGMILFFSPHKGSATVVNVFYDKTTYFVGTDQQNLDRMGQILNKICSGASIQTIGLTCSDFQYKTGQDKYRSIPAYIVASTMTETLPDGSSHEQDMTTFLVITQNSDYGILVSCPKDECANYKNELDHFVQSLNIYSVKAATNDYSNYSLLQGEWVKYKMYLKTESNDKSLQQMLQDAMTGQLSSLAGQQLKSLDEIDWIKLTVTGVSTDKITTHGEIQVLGKQIDSGDSSLEKSPSAAIPTNAKVGDTFDSPLSSPDNPSKVTVTDIKTENLLGNNVDVYVLSSSKTTPGDTLTTQMNQVLHYDTKTGIMLDWVVQMKIYNSTTFVNMEFGMVPIEWSQLTGTSAQTTSYNIPGWIKNSAKWWSQGEVTDDDFVKGIQYLVQQGIIEVPTTQVSSQSSQTIPSWVKNNAKWWSEGQLGDSDFVQGIQYLVQNGIIVTQNNNNGNNIPSLLDGAMFYTGPLSQPEMITYTDKWGNTLSVLAIPGDVLLYVSQDTNWNDVNQVITGNGGTILSKIPAIGYYEVQVNDVSKFISDIRQVSFVIDASPNFVISPAQTSPNFPNITDLTNYKTGVDINAGAKNPDPSSKVIVAVIDDFNGCYVLQTGSHGCHVIGEMQTKNPDLPIMALQWDGKNQNDLQKDIVAAIQTAKDNNQKIVFNFSWEIPLKDKAGHVVPDAQERYANFMKSTLDMLNNDYVKDGNVVFVKAAGNDDVDVSKGIDKIKSDEDVGQLFGKMYVLAGQLDKNTQSPMKYANNGGSNRGSGILYDDTTSDVCSTGTSCTSPNIGAAIAAIWNTHPELKSADIRNGIINSAKTVGNYNLLSPQDALNSITKCLPSCPQISYNTGKSSSNTSTPTTTGGNQPYGGYSTPEAYCQGKYGSNVHYDPSINKCVSYRGSSSPEAYCQGTYGSDYHYDSSTNKCVSYNGYNSADAYCQGTYGSDYHYDSSQQLCVPSSSSTSGGSGQQIGSSALGIDLTGQWGGTAQGTVGFSDINGQQITCQFSGALSLDLTQAGRDLGGSVTVSGLSLSGDGCDQASITQVGGTLKAIIFGSGFSGSVTGDGTLSVNGQFTSDLIRGTYSGNGGQYSISGDFTASRSG